MCHRRKLRYGPIICFFAVLWLISCDLLDQSPRLGSDSSVTFLNVGQGDASLIRLSDNRFYLIDAGPPNVEIAAKLAKMGASRLEWVVITHADLDHYGGLEEILLTHSIGKIYLPPDTSTVASWGKLLGEIKNKRIPTDTLYLGSFLEGAPEGKFAVLWPPRSSNLSGNNLSTVIQLASPSGNVLWTGDIETEAENEILQIGTLAPGTLLKVAHHGSRTSSGLPFLAAVQPRWAVISCDSSVYGHPHRETLAALTEIMTPDSKILRTDMKGDIVFQLAESGLSLE